MLTLYPLSSRRTFRWSKSENTIHFKASYEPRTHQEKYVVVDPKRSSEAPYFSRLRRALCMGGGGLFFGTLSLSNTLWSKI